MDNFIICEILMVIQLSLLLLHQMDSTYFKEWEIIPFVRMGYTSFLVITILLTVIQVVGIILLIFKERAGVVITITWGFMGLVVPVFHTYNYLKGDERFRSFWSASIIYLTMVVSVLLIVYGFRTL